MVRFIDGCVSMFLLARIVFICFISICIQSLQEVLVRVQSCLRSREVWLGVREVKWDVKWFVAMGTRHKNPLWWEETSTGQVSTQNIRI